MTIQWEKFFSGGNGKNYQCFYKAIINGVRCEKVESTILRTKYSIGNIDFSKNKFYSEQELLNFLTTNHS